jgi:ribonuclease HI
MRSAAEVNHSVERHIVDFQSLKSPSKPPKPPDITKWEKLQDNSVKVNLDGAYNKVTGSGGWGFIIRDSHGTFVAAGTGKACHLRDPLHAETVACSAAIKGVRKAGARRVIFESDSSNLLKALNSQDYDRSSTGARVRDARKNCSLHFDSVTFSFCRRACNSAAHELAKFSVSSDLSD